MFLILGLKLTLVPALIGLITLAGRRWGAAVAGWLSAFPVVGGPILFFVTHEQGAAFGARAATGTLSAVLAILVFNITYAWVALGQAWPLTATVAFAAYFSAVFAVNAWAPSLHEAALVVAAVLLVAPRLFPKPVHPTEVAAPPTRAQPTPSLLRSSDLPWRMAAAAALVLAVTCFSGTLGPRLSGMLAMFPVMASVLAVFSHRQIGAHFAVHLLRGAVIGYHAFSVFCFVLATALPAWGMAPGFLAALVGAVIVQGASLRFVRARS